MKELFAPNFSLQLLCIVYPETEGNFHVWASLINLFPFFYGYTSDDPYLHLKEFYLACSTQGMAEDSVER